MIILTQVANINVEHERGPVMLPPIMPQQQHFSLFDGSIYGNYFRFVGEPWTALIDPLLSPGGPSWSSSWPSGLVSSREKIHVEILSWPEIIRRNQREQKVKERLIYAD